MSWEREYVFYTQEKFPLSVSWFTSEDEVEPPNLSFHSRSDVFGIILRDIISHFPELTELQFFKENNIQDIELNDEILLSRLVTFDEAQQKAVVDNIDKLFDYTKTKPAIFEEWSADFSNDPLNELLEEIEEYEWDIENPPFSDNDSFEEVILLLKSIRFFFENALKQGLAVGYLDYIP
jgi:predicted house-cleaning noncanonical NTP pyrophosphatase (MazG superfamily)